MDEITRVASLNCRNWIVWYSIINLFDTRGNTEVYILCETRKMDYERVIMLTLCSLTILAYIMSLRHVSSRVFSI